jgi:hypothetical protein
MRFREIIGRPAERETDADEEAIRALITVLHAANNKDAGSCNAVLKAVTIEPFGSTKKPKSL